ncbi:hypothetical protein H6P81_017453 [Aristolochia fimbriata]|uniref:Uncharacterized protein n=1 Tax=Aristolochia fimbriata TaxID=158543 RepID=A0AAV7DZ99_ARIFI|nr:hypothetical protein H6P81_017453 [Aristolochia fimbriata]
MGQYFLSISSFEIAQQRDVYLHISEKKSIHNLQPTWQRRQPEDILNFEINTVDTRIALSSINLQPIRFCKSDFLLVTPHELGCMHILLRPAPSCRENQNSKSTRRPRMSEEELQLQTWKYVLGFVDAAVIKCAIELGIADTIKDQGGHMTLSELSQTLGCAPSSFGYCVTLSTRVCSTKCLELFNDALASVATTTVRAILLESVGVFEGLSTVVDVGGGNGTAMRMLVEKCSWIRAKGRCSLPHEDCSKKHGLSEVGLMLDMLMMAQTREGKERTEAEWKNVLAHAGFNTHTIKPILAAPSVIEAFP